MKDDATLARIRAHLYHNAALGCIARAQRDIEHAINCVPTGPARNKLTDINMMLMQLIDSGLKPQLPGDSYDHLDADPPFPAKD